MRNYVRLLLIALAVLAIFAAGCGKEQARVPKKNIETTRTIKKSKPATKPLAKQQSKTAMAPATGMSGTVDAGPLSQILQSGIAPASTPQTPLVPSLKPSAPPAQPARLSGVRPTPQQLLAAIQTVYRSAKSIKIESKALTVSQIDGKVARRDSAPASTLILKRPDKFIISDVSGKLCSDGKTVYRYVTAAKRFTKTKMSKEIIGQLIMGKPGVGVVGLFFGIDYAPAIASMSLLKDSKVGREDTFVMKLKLKSGVGVPDGVTASQTLWISKKTLAVYKNELDMTAHAKPGAKGPKVMRTIMTGTLTSFVPNPNIPDSQFAFHPPSDVKPLEQPKMVNLNDKPAPDFSFKWTDGSEKKLSDFRGKVVLLDFWALPMCAEHLPILQRIYETHPDITIVSINFNSEAAKVKEYVDKKKYTFPIVQANEQIAETAQKKYGIMGLPTMYLVDGEGTIKRTLLGNPKVEDIDAKLAKVK